MGSESGELEAYNARGDLFRYFPDAFVRIDRPVQCHIGSGFALGVAGLHSHALGIAYQVLLVVRHFDDRCNAAGGRSASAGVQSFRAGLASRMNLRIDRARKYPGAVPFALDVRARRLLGSDVPNGPILYRQISAL